MRTITGLDELKAAEGEVLGVSDWHEVTQKDVDTFADVMDGLPEEDLPPAV